MHNLFKQNPTHTKRILAHRQTWLENNSMNMTASQKTQSEQYIKSWDQNVILSWSDSYSATKSNISIFDLINSENVRARTITNAVDIDNANQE